MNTEKITPLEAIRDKCLDCTCNQPKEVRACEITKCPLWAFRLKKPLYTRTSGLTEEQKKAAGERLKAAREQNND